MATALLSSHLSNDLVERISQDVHKLRMKDVLVELEDVHFDVDTIYSKVLRRFPKTGISDSPLKSRSALNYLQVLTGNRGFLVYAHAFVYVTIQELPNNRWLIYYIDMTCYRRFIMEIMFYQLQTEGLLCIVERGIVWGFCWLWAKSRLSSIIKNIMGVKDLMGVDRGNCEDWVMYGEKGRRMPFHSWVCMCNVLDLIQIISTNNLYSRYCPSYVYASPYLGPL